MTKQKSMFLVKLLVILVFMIGIFSCVKAPLATTRSGYSGIFTMPDNLTTWTLNVKRNSYFIIRARGNPSTGYAWYVTSTSDPKMHFIKLLNLNHDGSTDAFESDPHPAGMVGVGGFYYFIIRAKNTGSAILVMEYKRAWQSISLRTVKVIINVK